MSAILERDCCILNKNYPDGSSEICCRLTEERVMTFVLLLISALFLSLGSYFLFGSIGTIPSMTTGCALVAVGIGSILFCCYKSFKKTN